MGAQQSAQAAEKGPIEASKPVDVQEELEEDNQDAVKAHAIDCCSVASSYQSVSDLDEFFKPGEASLGRWSVRSLPPASELLNNPIYEGDELVALAEEDAEHDPEAKRGEVEGTADAAAASGAEGADGSSAQVSTPSVNADTAASIPPGAALDAASGTAAALSQLESDLLEVEVLGIAPASKAVASLDRSPSQARTCFSRPPIASHAVLAPPVLAATVDADAAPLGAPEGQPPAVVSIGNAAPKEKSAAPPAAGVVTSKARSGPVEPETSSSTPSHAAAALSGAVDPLLAPAAAAAPAAALAGGNVGGIAVAAGSDVAVASRSIDVTSMSPAAKPAISRTAASAVGPAAGASVAAFETLAATPLTGSTSPAAAVEAFAAKLPEPMTPAAEVEPKDVVTKTQEGLVVSAASAPTTLPPSAAVLTLSEGPAPSASLGGVTGGEPEPETTVVEPAAANEVTPATGAAIKSSVAERAAATAEVVGEKHEAAVPATAADVTPTAPAEKPMVAMPAPAAKPAAADERHEEAVPAPVAAVVQAAGEKLAAAVPVEEVKPALVDDAPPAAEKELAVDVSAAQEKATPVLADGKPVSLEVPELKAPAVEKAAMAIADKPAVNVSESSAAEDKSAAEGIKQAAADEEPAAAETMAEGTAAEEPVLPMVPSLSAAVTSTAADAIGLGGILATMVTSMKPADAETALVKEQVVPEAATVVEEVAKAAVALKDVVSNGSAAVPASAVAAANAAGSAVVEAAAVPDSIVGMLETAPKEVAALPAAVEAKVVKAEQGSISSLASAAAVSTASAIANKPAAIQEAAAAVSTAASDVPSVEALPAAAGAIFASAEKAAEVGIAVLPSAAGSKVEAAVEPIISAIAAKGAVPVLAEGENVDPSVAASTRSLATDEVAEAAKDKVAPFASLVAAKVEKAAPLAVLVPASAEVVVQSVGELAPAAVAPVLTVENMAAVVKPAAEVVCVEAAEAVVTKGCALPIAVAGEVEPVAEQEAKIPALAAQAEVVAEALTAVQQEAKPGAATSLDNADDAPLSTQVLVDTFQGDMARSSDNDVAPAIGLQPASQVAAAGMADSKAREAAKGKAAQTYAAVAETVEAAIETEASPAAADVELMAVESVAAAAPVEAKLEVEGAELNSKAAAAVSIKSLPPSGGPAVEPKGQAKVDAVIAPAPRTAAEPLGAIDRLRSHRVIMDDILSSEDEDALADEEGGGVPRPRSARGSLPVPGTVRTHNVGPQVDALAHAANEARSSVTVPSAGQVVAGAGGVASEVSTTMSAVAGGAVVDAKAGAATAGAQAAENAKTAEAAVLGVAKATGDAIEDADANGRIMVKTAADSAADGKKAAVKKVQDVAAGAAAGKKAAPKGGLFSCFACFSPRE